MPKSTDQWYNYIKLINECDGMFDYSAYDYTGAAAGTTPITDIWTGWKTTDESAFVYKIGAEILYVRQEKPEF